MKKLLVFFSEILVCLGTMLILVIFDVSNKKAAARRSQNEKDWPFSSRRQKHV